MMLNFFFLFIGHQFVFLWNVYSSPFLILKMFLFLNGKILYTSLYQRYMLQILSTNLWPPIHFFNDFFLSAGIFNFVEVLTIPLKYNWHQKDIKCNHNSNNHLSSPEYTMKLKWVFHTRLRSVTDFWSRVSSTTLIHTTWLNGFPFLSLFPVV